MTPIRSEFKQRKEFLSFAPPCVGEEEKKAVVETLESGWLTTGPKVKKFEDRFLKYVAAEAAVAVSSCTAGLHLSLIAAGVTSGDEVIVPTFTFASTAHVVAYQGAKPVFVDIDPQKMTVLPRAIEAAITSKTKAIVVVHYGGTACELDVIQQIAEKYCLPIVEDAAHAIGTEYKGQRIGGMGNLTCFSFYATKNMTTGEGGMLTTSDSELADKVRVLSMYGIDDARKMVNRYGPRGQAQYDIQALGYKYNMTDIDAAIGIEQLKKLEAFIRRRSEIAKIYRDQFVGEDQIALPFFSEENGNRCSWHLFPVLLSLERLRIGRDELIEALRALNIGTSVLFRPLHLHSYYQKTFGYQEGQFPVAENVYQRIISLPIHPGMTNEDAHYVADAFRYVLSQNRK